MTEKELKAALHTLEPEHPFARAVAALLADAVSVETAAVASPGASGPAREFNAGRLAHALDLQATVAALVRRA